MLCSHNLRSKATWSGTDEWSCQPVLNTVFTVNDSSLNNKIDRGAVDGKHSTAIALARWFIVTLLTRLLTVSSTTSATRLLIPSPFPLSEISILSSVMGLRHCEYTTNGMVWQHLDKYIIWYSSCLQWVLPNNLTSYRISYQRWLASW